MSEPATKDAKRKQFCRIVRTSGSILAGFGIGLVFAESKWLNHMSSSDILGFGIIAIITGFLLRSTRTRDERARVREKKAERYAWIIGKLGAKNTALAHNICLGITAVLVIAAVMVLASGSFKFVWALLLLAALFLILTSVTRDPNRRLLG